MLTLDRIEHRDIRGSVMVEIASSHLARLLIFFAAFPARLVRDVIVDDLRVFSVQCLAFPANAEEAATPGRP